jgi:RNA polymerase sigma factor (TIGR02999 family)
MLTRMDDLTRVLNDLDKGDLTASQRLFPLIYDELRRLAAHQLAAERPGQTLQATALVNEVFLRLSGGASPGNWDHRGHFFTAAAEAMRRILIDSARRKKRLKRGGDAERVDLPVDHIAGPMPDQQLLALDEALERFEREFPEKATVVKLRFFAGLTNEEAAQSLGISTATAQRHWTFARAWLFSRLAD